MDTILLQLFSISYLAKTSLSDIGVDGYMKILHPSGISTADLGRTGPLCPFHNMTSIVTKIAQ